MRGMYIDFLLPPVNLMGSGTVKQVGDRCKMAGGKKALLVTDPGMPKEIVNVVKGYVEEAGLKTVLFDKASINPTDKNVLDGVKVYKDEGCDIIVTVGGGSAHDAGKGIGIMANHPGHPYDYAGIEMLKHNPPPVVCVNTTAGTASEVTRHCVLTHSEQKVKFVIVSARNLPVVSINDPELMIGKPAALTAATGVDAIVHAIEAYLCIYNPNPLAKMCGYRATEIIAKWLRPAVANGKDLEAREWMAYGSMIAGMAFSNSGTGYVHAMAHQLGGFWDVPHGVANAILLPPVAKFNMSSNFTAYAELAVALGENICGLSERDAAVKAVEAMAQLTKDVGIPSGLRELGTVKQDSFEKMAEYALKDGNAGANPIQGTKADIIKLFEAAW